MVALTTVIIELSAAIGKLNGKREEKDSWCENEYERAVYWENKWVEPVERHPKELL